MPKKFAKARNKSEKRPARSKNGKIGACEAAGALIGKIREETQHANKTHKFQRSALYGLLSDCDLIRHWFDFELQAEMRLYPVPWSLTRCCSLHARGLASTLPGLA